MMWSINMLSGSTVSEDSTLGRGSRVDKAIVVFSGGQDSTTCLFWARQHFSSVEAVTFDYGQRHKKEVEVACEIARDLDVPHTVLDLDVLAQIVPSALTRDEIEVKAGRDVGMPTTFVDGRNLLFLSFAAIVGRQKGAKDIVTGVCQTDFSGYPDCRDIFVKSLNVTLNLAMDDQFVIHTPLMWLNKAETWALADELGVFDYVRERTLTCYHGIPGDGCGACPACALRRRGLEQYMEQKKGQKKGK